MINANRAGFRLDRPFPHLLPAWFRFDPNPAPADQPADPPEDPTPADPPRTFTPDDVERIVKERLARDRRDRPSDEEIAKLTERASKLDEMEAANQTELEKAQARADQAEKTAAETEKRGREALLRASIVAEAAKGDRRVADPEATVTFLTGPDVDLLEIDDAGNPKDIAKAMDELLERRAYLVVAAGGSRGDADQGARGGGANQLTREKLASMSHAEIVKAQDEGRLDSLLGVKQ